MRLKGRAKGVTLSPPRGGSVAPPTKGFPCEPFPRSPLGSQKRSKQSKCTLCRLSREKQKSFGHKPRNLSGYCKPSSFKPLEMGGAL